MNKIRGNEVIFESENGNVAVTYSVFDLGGQYKVYRKVVYMPESECGWEYVNTFGTIGLAVGYANHIFDEPVMRYEGEGIL